MKLNRTGSLWDRNQRNGINENWQIIEGDYKNIVDNVSNKAYQQVVDNAKLNWKEPVNSYSNLPSSATKGDTRMTRDTGKVYRYSGTAWQEIQQIDAGPVNALETQLNETTGEITERSNTIHLNALYPPAPLNRLVGDAKYYNSSEFKYYSDSAMSLPATDNTPRLQAIVNHVHQNGGGTIYIPAGEYVFRNDVKWQTKVSLVGGGRSATKLYAEGVQHSLITGTEERAPDGSDADNPDVWFEDCTFRDFLIDNKGLSYPTRTVGGKALFILYMKRAVFRDLILMNTLGTALGCDFLDDTVIENVFTHRAGRSLDSSVGPLGGQSGIGIGTSALAEETVIINNCFAYDSGNYGIFVETQHSPQGFKSKGAKITNCHAQGNRIGFSNKGSGGAQWIGNTAYKNSIDGFHITQGSFGDLISDNIIDSNGGNGIYIGGDYLGDLKISNNVIKNNGHRGIWNVNKPEIIKTNINISNNNIFNNGFMGVHSASGVDGFKMHSNTIFNNGQNGQNSNQTNRGVFLVNKHINAVIKDNLIYDNQETKTQNVGINIGVGDSECYVDGNDLRDYGNLALIESGNNFIGQNNGLVTTKSGMSTIPDGEIVLEIIHALGRVPNNILITPFHNSASSMPAIWVDRRDGNIIRVRRESGSGTLDFYWKIEI